MIPPKQVITRFPPSPTGLFHVGSARTALFNYLYAKKHGGKLILRIEDTDKERSKKEYEENIIEGLSWLGIGYDEFYRQSERTDVYHEQIEKLLSSGAAYESEETVGEHTSVIRFKNPGGVVSFHDEIRGDISFDVTELGDFVIAKDRETPLYHLAVVVDDFLMGVTHVIRGEDGISNTPRQILIARALGAPDFTYAHIPLILAPDKSKLSKRHGAVALTEYREKGYVPEAIINFLALLGWSPQGKDTIGDQELFTLAELVEHFDLSKVQKGGAIFSVDKLNWFNREYIKRLENPELLSLLKKYVPSFDDTLIPLLPFLSERMTTLADAIPLLAPGGELSFFLEYVKPTKELLKTPEHLTHTAELLGNISENEFTAEHIKEAVWDYANREGRGVVLWPLRVALTGLERSPDPFTVAELLGKKETLIRITYAQSLA